MLRIVDDRLSQQRLESDLVYLVSLTDVYRPPLVPVEAALKRLLGSGSWTSSGAVEGSRREPLGPLLSILAAQGARSSG